VSQKFESQFAIEDHVRTPYGPGVVVAVVFWIDQVRYHVRLRHGAVVTVDSYDVRAELRVASCS